MQTVSIYKAERPFGVHYQIVVESVSVNMRNKIYYDMFSRC